MANKFNKRGKLPRMIDSWLDSLGFYRKNIAYDETCLFRTVAEQYYDSQLYHERVRTDCIEYGQKNYKEFRHVVPNRQDWFERLKNLSIHMLVCSDIEIELITKTYNVNIKLFNGYERTVEEFNCNFNKDCKTLLICQTSTDHYDSVYTKEYIIDAGFCQSIVYNILYEDVFEIKNVASIVNTMLHDKEQSSFLNEGKLFKTDFSSDEEEEDKDKQYFSDDSSDNYNNNKSNMLVPFSFKVAKALDPNMYRNIEYDTWIEVRRAFRLGDWYYGDDKLILGTQCLVDVDGKPSSCYIQEILKNEDKCIVYIIKLAERWSVKYSDLRPENNAKPWPLPYRFDRCLQTPPDNPKKTFKRRKEKKTSQDLEISLNGVSNGSDINIHNFKGCPLLMQQLANSSLPDESSLSNNGYSLESKDWNEVHHNITDESIINDPEELCPFTENKASDPSSPIVDQDINEEGHMFYNYESEYSYPMTIWAQPSDTSMTASAPPPPSQPGPYMVPSDTRIPFSLNEPPPALDINRNLQNYVYYATDNSYSSPTYFSPPLSTPPSPFPPLAVPVGDRFVCSTPLPAVSPCVDVYPFMYPVVAPGTPVLYSHPAVPPPPSTPISPLVLSEAMPSVGSPLPLFTRPNEVQYINSSPHMYAPQTPQMTWYPQNVNARGFIFPAPLNTTAPSTAL